MVISGILLLILLRKENILKISLPYNPGGRNFAVARAFREMKRTMHRELMSPYLKKKSRHLGYVRVFIQPNATEFTYAIFTSQKIALKLLNSSDCDSVCH